MEIDNETGLVLEGGGMRGVFTCGVLDYFMDHNIQFPYTIGVSAGACNGLSYMSHQRGRARFSNIELMEKYHFISIKHLFRTGCILDLKLLYKDFPEKILPYDYQAYADNPNRFEMVATDCLSGRSVYLEEKYDIPRIMNIAQASSSLPFVCPMVRVDGRPMLDGGIIDSIPLMRAYEEGYKKCVVVLTRNKGYRKRVKDIKIPNFIYTDFPRLRLALSNRCKAYNEQLEMIEKLEDEGRILTIRPLRPLEVNRTESNITKLKALYQEGYECAEALDVSKRRFII